MILKAITYCYIQDENECQKVVGIFTRDKLDEALDDIRNGFGKQDGRVKVRDEYDKSCDNYLIEYSDTEQSWFYTSDYELNELML